MQDFERFNIHILLFLNRVTVSNLFKDLNKLTSDIQHVQVVIYHDLHICRKLAVRSFCVALWSTTHTFIHVYD